eukprot:5868126-Prymnesium_polylepis.1
MRGEAPVEEAGLAPLEPGAAARRPSFTRPSASSRRSRSRVALPGTSTRGVAPGRLSDWPPSPLEAPPRPAPPSWTGRAPLAERPGSGGVM